MPWPLDLSRPWSYNFCGQRIGVPVHDRLRTQAMPHFRPLPSVQRLKEIFDIDEHSPSGLRNKVTRGRLKAGLPAGTKGSCYWVAAIDGHYYTVQRIVYAIHNGVDPQESLVDHINRNRYDNTPSNLRLVHHQLNAVNVGLFSHNTTGVRGVSYNKRDNVFYAQIKVKRKILHLGSFSTVEEAAEVRKQAELKFFGENC